MTHDSLSDRVFENLRNALNARTPFGTAMELEHQVAVDRGRADRTGVPEIVYAPGKTTKQLISAVGQLLDSEGRVVVSRVDEPIVRELESTFAEASLIYRPGSCTVVIALSDEKIDKTGGRVAVFAAGTTDWPAANEARVVAEEMGCHVSVVMDVGVAGLHRLIRPLRTILDDGVDAIVVAAGMDGALPSVVAGLVPVPVIGLPTSVGYGHGGNGEAALMSMLQSCAPGMTVVNIDNAVGAGASAALIANAVARARQGSLDGSV
jgi:pyridinium-3,5-biscarboxylic acid mononucleotide synthase